MNFRQYSEKRDWYRTEIESAAEFRRAGAADKVYSGKTLNLSGGGVAFETEEPVEVGEELLVTVATYGDLIQPLQAKAQVKRVSESADSKYIIASQFLEVS